MKLLAKNWKLTLIALSFFCLLSALGYWQLLRAHEKEKLLATYHQRAQQPMLRASALNFSSREGAANSTANNAAIGTSGARAEDNAAPKNALADLRFYRLQLTGHFDNAHSFLLDNKIVAGKVGYELYTPFIAHHLSTAILIDRGFIASPSSRQILPPITAIVGETTIQGILNLPPKWVSLGPLIDAKELRWPLRIEYVQLNKLGRLLQQPLFPYVLMQEINTLTDDKQIVNMPPARHRGYALQWFALALTLLILFVALNRRTSS